MITGQINHYDSYVHIESGRKCEVRDPALLVKLESRMMAAEGWITCISYSMLDDETGAVFAVPVDDFRKKFKKEEN